MIQILKAVEYNVDEVWWLEAGKFSYADVGYAIETFLHADTDHKKVFYRFPLKEKMPIPPFEENAKVESIPIRHATFKFMYHIHNGKRNKE